MPKPYKRTPFRRIVHQKNATPRFQPTDRDIQAQKQLKLKLSRQHQLSQPLPGQITPDPPLPQNNEHSTSSTQQLQDPNLNIPDIDLRSVFYSIQLT